MKITFECEQEEGELLLKGRDAYFAMEEIYSKVRNYLKYAEQTPETSEKLLEEVRAISGQFV